VTSLSATASGNGYWFFTSRGRVLPMGDAVHLGDMSSVTLNGPVLDSIRTPSGRGYYMVASDGGIFSFGDAVFYGSTGSMRLNAPVQSLVPDPDGVGYWLVASDGGVFAFDAGFRGSMGGKPLNKPMTGMVPYGNGYLMVAEDAASSPSPTRASWASLGSTPPAGPSCPSPPSANERPQAPERRKQNALKGCGPSDVVRSPLRPPHEGRVVVEARKSILCFRKGLGSPYGGTVPRSARRRRRPDASTSSIGGPRSQPEGRLEGRPSAGAGVGVEIGDGLRVEDAAHTGHGSSVPQRTAPANPTPVPC
jgi:hypothetical protein